MKLVAMTIVLNGMPWITFHYPVLRRLTCEWEWHVVEGVAAPEHCTKWCARLSPGLSTDGTKAYLDSLAFDQRVKIYRNEMWQGKIAMVNEPLRYLFEPCLLLQLDSDEIWTAEQLTKLVELFKANPHKNAAYFWCRYFMGPEIVITGRNCFGNHQEYEWLRAWRFKPGMHFLTHEPPVINGLKALCFDHNETEQAGLVFDHYAYATEAQVAFKERYYGSSSNQLGSKYKNAVARWKVLQANQQWPIHSLEDWLPWVGAGAAADRLQ